MKGWRDISEERRETMEQECIQALMLCAILASSPQLAASLRRVLRGFHDQKSAKGVDCMLHRLYEPILWRHLKAVHPDVRCNALSLLFCAFPIQVRSQYLFSPMNRFSLEKMKKKKTLKNPIVCFNIIYACFYYCLHLYNQSILKTWTVDLENNITAGAIAFEPGIGYRSASLIVRPTINKKPVEKFCPELA